MAPAAYDRCVRKVKAKGGAVNPYAICRSTMGSDKEILAKQKKKKKKGY